MIETAPNPDVESKPLTEWTNAPTLSALKQDLQDAKPIADAQKAKIREWLDNLNVTGKAQPKTPDGNSKIQPKLIRKQAEWRYASLSEPFLSTPHIFKVKPVTWEDKKAAVQNELLLNHQFNNEIDKVAFVDEYVRTAVDEGTVAVRVGWEFEEEEVEVEVPVVQFVVDPEFQPTIDYVAQLKEESPSQFDTDVPDELKEALEHSIEQGVAVRPNILGKKLEKQMKTVKNRPTVEIVNYNNLIIDPLSGGDVKKANFIALTYESSVAQLSKEGKRYKNLDRIDLEGNSLLSEPDHVALESSKTFNFTDHPRKKFVVQEYWGFWDIHGTGKLVPIVVSWVGNTLIRMEVTPFPDKCLPFVVRHYLPVRKSTHGEPDGSLLEDNQKIIGAVTRGMIDILGKSANGQTGIMKGLLDATNRRKFERGQDYEFNPQVADPRLGVHMHTYPEIPQSAQIMLQMQNMEAESMTGVKSFNQGVSGTSLGDVAAGIRGALDAASKRELGILRRLASGIVEIGRKFISMNAEFLSEREVVRVTNDQFVTIRKDDLPGKFDLELTISTAEEDNNKAEQLAFMFQTNGPNGDPGLNKMILAEIARLRKMPDIAHQIETYQPQPDPMVQRLQELEAQKLEAEIAELRSRAQKNATDAVLTEAKAGTEQVKQGNLAADTDQKRLDFVEQESGVKQEREKELHGEQARSQTQLKLIERQTQLQGQRVDLVKEYIKAQAQKAKAKSA